VTGAGDETTAVRAMRAGAFDYLIKDRDRRYLDLVAVTIDRARRHLHAALHDDITGLPNRLLFMDRLANALDRARHRRHELAVIFFDLDRFKMINDGLGHRVGDALLERIANRLLGCLRQGDTLARLGGDEFAVLVDEVEDSAEIDRVAERLHATFAEPVAVDGHEVFTSASLGIVRSSARHETAEDLLRDADIAMYRAKAGGQIRRVTFEPHMHQQAVDALSLENDLRRAIERDQLEVHFQPILDLQAGHLAAFEALVRWRHPDRGLVMPGEFLPLAQETHLSAEIGWFVLEESCRRLASWVGNAAASVNGLGVSVNLDARQLASPSLVDRVETVLATAGLDARRLRLEITEGMIIEDPEHAAVVLGRLRKRGIGLHIDDFGTGYSSLSQLKTLPVDALKIDRSFVSRMLTDQDDAEIVRAITQLGQNLRLEVMGEGIEEVEHLAALRELGCAFGQGYLFARPLDADAAGELVSRTAPFPGFDETVNPAG
ncbi:MAG: EAL domain-containing protein, partial [Acidobacteriota bacterium]